VQRLSEQNFDYALSWFGDEAPEMAEGAAFVHLQKGPKWPGLEKTIVAHWDTVKQYRYLWLPDDDLLCVPEQVSRMFAVCSDLKLELAQPALTTDSYFTHVITLQHSAFQVRFTNFVEIMAPVLSIDLFARIFHSLQGKHQRLRPRCVVAAFHPARPRRDHRRHAGETHPSGRRAQLRLQQEGRRAAGGRRLADLGTLVHRA